jgi:glycine cleavage system H protein
VADYDFPEELLYTEDDEWVRDEGDHIVIGITDFAQSQLGDIVFVELPEVGSVVEVGMPFGTIESVKAVSDLCAPMNGEVLRINRALENAPELINQACYAEGWLITLNPSDEVGQDALMDSEAYAESVADRDS